MDVLELLGALHHALQQDVTFADPVAWRDALAIIRREVEADPATDRYDRETLDVITLKLDTLIAEIENGVADPDFKPARTWVAALGAAIHRRRTAEAAAADEAGRPVGKPH
ncbi:hypothetical protein SAMN02745157_4071 [Kaistia soli DSM 19436]|uniref:Uncharacterized protein n=1 Tax=Kaistia soli DSM 19436 TaxID=1122133 RepID=A0A1M5J1D8_9HYPH|nr:hypothetical protein [Kaistia soli]SHG34366.1 hypothetical protein SAMN02745157_4071 [Kaistia soli DSM 19436]